MQLVPLDITHVVDQIDGAAGGAKADCRQDADHDRAEIGELAIEHQRREDEPVLSPLQRAHRLQQRKRRLLRRRLCRHVRNNGRCGFSWLIQWRLAAHVIQILRSVRLLEPRSSLDESIVAPSAPCRQQRGRHGGQRKHWHTSWIHNIRLIHSASAEPLDKQMSALSLGTLSGYRAKKRAWFVLVSML